MTLRCTYSNCTGEVIDGFCDSCGRVPPEEIATAPASSATGQRAAAAQIARVGGYSGTTGRVTGARRPMATAAGTPGITASAASRGSAATGSTGTAAGGSGTSSRRGSRGSSSRRRALGGGLVQMPVMPSTDPLLLVMQDARVPAAKCFCPSCRNPVNPDKRFCSNCGTEYNFRPSLRTGEVVAGQYEVKGPIAFGGLGWIYLAMDTRLNRWVVLKGLLNTKDEAAAAAAVAERQFLAAVKHGKIVGIYTFVTHDAESYIVMEYVGGRTLKALRRERGPLPVAEAIAYILGILPAFQYLHDQNLVYCDFKPDNVMLEGEDVKLIDMGAVRRIGDPHGDIYGTVGYKAPEADDDPVVASDLYTVARTLAALLIDFDNTGRNRASLPAPNALMHMVPVAMIEAAGVAATASLRATLADGAALPGWLAFSPGLRAFTGTAPPGVTAVAVRVTATDETGATATLPLTLGLPLAANESLYRFLLKGTAPDPDARFQSADEMAAQLLGILREVVARDGKVPAADSAEFLHERSIGGALFDPDRARAAAWRRLPELRLDTEDPAIAELFAAGAAPSLAQRADVLEATMRARPASAEAPLRLADARVDLGEADPDQIISLLDAALALDPFDWRPDWYCGKLYLSLGRAGDAVACFDKVYSEIPGECVPKLALAMALEQEGRLDEAAGLYDTVSRIDSSLTSAAFGLARCRMAVGDRDGAVLAYGRVPENAATYHDAQLAAVRALSDASVGAPSLSDLARASEMLAAMPRDDIPRHEAEAALAMEAARQVELGGLSPAGAHPALLGTRLQPGALRRRAETALRACARLSEFRADRIAYIDRANAVRPRTLV
jgi:serine/threonine-protein kinase PknG